MAHYFIILLLNPFGLRVEGRDGGSSTLCIIVADLLVSRGC